LDVMVSATNAHVPLFRHGNEILTHS